MFSQHANGLNFGYGHERRPGRVGGCHSDVPLHGSCGKRGRRVHRFQPIELMTSDVTAEWIPEFGTEGLILTVTGDVNRIAMYRTAIMVLGQPIKGDFDNLPVFLRVGNSNDTTVSVGVDDRHHRFGYGSRFAEESEGEVGGQCEATIEIVPACEEPTNIPRPECRPRPRGRLIPMKTSDGMVAFGRALPNWRCKPLGVCLQFTNNNTVILL